MDYYKSSRMAQDAQKSTQGCPPSPKAQSGEIEPLAALVSAFGSQSSIRNLADVRSDQFEAYWSAPRAARDIHILAAIQQGWASLEAEQFAGVPFTLTAFAGAAR